jgi:hypothetical protein
MSAPWVGVSRVARVNWMLGVAALAAALSLLCVDAQLGLIPAALIIGWTHVGSP